MTIRSLTQYNTGTHEVSNNIRFNLIHRPGSDLFVVYNDLRQTGLPADVFQQMLTAASPGGFYASAVRGQYQGVRQ